MRDQAVGSQAALSSHSVLEAPAFGEGERVAGAVQASDNDHLTFLHDIVDRMPVVRDHPEAVAKLVTRRTGQRKIP